VNYLSPDDSSTMNSLHLLQIFLFCLSLSVLIVTAWVIISGNDLSSQFIYGDVACNCENGLEGSSNSGVAEDGLMFVGKDSELSARSLKECKEKMRTFKERLDWEISRGDWRDAEVDYGNKKVKNNRADTRDIKILVNGKRSVNGFSTNEDIYVPFSAIREEYEAHGEYNKKGVFEWKNAIIRPWDVPRSYDPVGLYVGLENAVVENRKRVKCIDGIYEVPVTTQWDKNGYFYATQIAQYGLAHYNNFLKVGASRKRTILQQWNPAHSLAESGEVKTVYSKEKRRDVTYFAGRIAFNRKEIFNQTRGMNILTLEVKLDPESEIVLGIRIDNTDYFNIRYVVNSKEFISCSHPNIQIRIGHSSGWRKITRDLKNDLMKGIVSCKNFNRKLPEFDGLQRLTFIGSGSIGDVKVSKSAHEEMFLNAAKWLLKFQDDQGAWPVNVTRKIIPQVVSPPGWKSAMASGQAISLLCRVYSYTNRPEYFKAAVRALKLFDIPVSKNGFVSTVLGNLPMYEEYPSDPSLHVLNGFIFALIGLYDLSSLEQGNKEARHLFDVGIKTLLRILPMYDNGRGTFYDLRHVVIPGVEPKRARWDYHAVHLGQLELLKTIVNDEVIDKILTRWKGYVDGVPARHN